MFDIFREQHPNIEINPIYVPGQELDQKTDLMIAAGTPPDLWFPGAGRGNRYYADKGQLMVLDPFLDEEGYDMTDFYERALTLCKWDGYYQSLPIDQNTMFFCYNKDLFDEAGLDYPPTDWDDKTWTWDKFLEVCKALTKEEGGKIVQYGTSSGFGTSRFSAWVFGGDWFDKESNETGYAKQFLWRRDQVEAGLQYTADLMNVHRVMPSPEEAQEFAPGIPLHMTGKIGIWAAHTSSLLGYKEIKEFEWGICTVPKLPELPRRLKCFINQWMIFRGSHHPEEAWMLMRHMMSPEMMDIYPVEKGRLPARKSLDTHWWEWLNEILPHLMDEELKCIRGSAEIAYPTSSFSMVHFAEYWGKAMKPELDKVWLGDITAKEAIANMVPVMQNISYQPDMKVGK